MSDSVQPRSVVLIKADAHTAHHVVRTLSKEYEINITVDPLSAANFLRDGTPVALQDPGPLIPPMQAAGSTLSLLVLGPKDINPRQHRGIGSPGGLNRSGRARQANLKALKEEIQRKTVKSLLRENLGNISKTSRELGISRPTLYKLMSRYKFSR